MNREKWIKNFPKWTEEYFLEREYAIPLRMFGELCLFFDSRENVKKPLQLINKFSTGEISPVGSYKSLKYVAKHYAKYKCGNVPLYRDIILDENNEKLEIIQSKNFDEIWCNVPRKKSLKRIYSKDFGQYTLLERNEFIAGIVNDLALRESEGVASSKNFFDNHKNLFTKIKNTNELKTEIEKQLKEFECVADMLPPVFDDINTLLNMSLETISELETLVKAYRNAVDGNPQCYKSLIAKLPDKEIQYLKEEKGMEL